jgi:hypothetical protein
MPAGYTTDIVQRDDGEYYWHLWRWNQRVNGGLSESYAEAFQDASLAARNDVNRPVALPRPEQQQREDQRVPVVVLDAARPLERDEAPLNPDRLRVVSYDRPGRE